jgi:hypothetical protein
VIENATITSLQLPAASNRFGDPAWATPTALSSRCCLDNTEHAQRIIQRSRQKDSTAICYVLTSRISVEPVTGAQLDATLDGGSSTRYEVTDRKIFEKAGGLSHYELFLREME